MPRRHVNERQRDILRWIAEGCPERDWPDETHKHSARALANRGLVRVSRSSGRWTAVLTDDGKHFHQHGEYPDADRIGPKPPEPELPVTPVTESENPGKRGRGTVSESPVSLPCGWPGAGWQG